MNKLAGSAGSCGRGHGQHGQALVEFSLSAIVLLLLMAGLLDLGRVFYYDVSMHGAAREGARHAAWFDPGTDSNPYLSDAEVLKQVNQNLGGSHLTAVFPNGGSTSTCPAPKDGNPYNNPPFDSSVYPNQLNTPWVYVCYKTAGGSYGGSRSSAPTDNSFLLGDVSVTIVMAYGLVTAFLQGILGNGFPVVAYAHFTIQGTPP